MKPARPKGFAALLAQMPPDFVAQAKAVEEQARRRRQAQAERFEREFFGRSGTAGKRAPAKRQAAVEAGED